jgi:addiction module HigA family antidote
MVRIPTHREPTHPGEMLLEEFLNPMGITQRELAEKIHVPYQRVNEIINKRRGITPSTALRLAKLFRLSEDFWMNLQLRWDLYREALHLNEYRTELFMLVIILRYANQFGGGLTYYSGTRQ